MVGAVVTACVVGDPGWHYEAPIGTPIQENGLRYDVKDPSGLLVRVYAGAFTGSLDADVDVIGSSVPLASNSHLTLNVIDGTGRPLPPHRLRPASSRCRLGGRQGSGFAPDVMVCSATASFAIHPVAGCSRNPDLDRVMIAIGGVGAGPLHEVRVAMRAD